MYDELKLNSEVFVVKNMENSIVVAAFDANKFDISPDEFELKNGRYYSNLYINSQDKS